MGASFKDTLSSLNESYLKRISLQILQVNVGDRCNQKCVHCHVGAGPDGSRTMSRKIMDDVISFLSKKKGLILDVTGGCPELNPNLKYLVQKALPHTKEIIIRANLTVLFDTDAKDLMAFYRDKKIHLICSMPCYTEENVDRQRGKGVFEKSIKALKHLNDLGYGKDSSLRIDLVYNPGGAFLPADQSSLERDYKSILREKYGIGFNRLLTITNAPINRFEKYLRANGNYDDYMKLLMDNFNKDIAGNIMCRMLLSVGWDGVLYDCDFNQALGLPFKKNNARALKINDLTSDEIGEIEIVFDNHCYCCTAGAGSSCTGALKD